MIFINMKKIKDDDIPSLHQLTQSLLCLSSALLDIAVSCSAALLSARMTKEDRTATGWSDSTSP